MSEKVSIQGAPTFETVLSTLQHLVREMELQVHALSTRVRNEVLELSSIVDNVRQEIRGLEPEDLKRHHIRAANDELDAVVQHLESATHDILNACEGLEEIAADLPPEKQEDFQNLLARIYESCSFHDISGQRIRKVVDTLKEIERRLGLLLRTYGADLVEPEDKPAKRDPLMQGPALPHEAPSQEEIDALLG